MCGPAPLALGAAALSAAGSIQGGIAAREQGKYAAAVAQRNASLADDQAREANDQGSIAQKQLARKYAALKGSQAAAMAASGIDLGFGSALRTQEDTLMLYGEDASALASNTANQRRGYEFSAANSRSEAQASRMQGKAAFTAGLFGAATSILGGASQYKHLKAQGY
jgi:hypothetical protein